MKEKKKKKNISNTDQLPKKQNRFTVEFARTVRVTVDFFRRFTGTSAGAAQGEEDVVVSSAHTSIHSLNDMEDEIGTASGGPGERRPLLHLDGGKIAVPIEGRLPDDIILDEEEDDDEDLYEKFPKEKLKTVIILLILFLVGYLNTLSLVLTHQRQSDKIKVPLPDIVLDNVRTVDEALYAAEIIIIISFVISLALIVFHRFRWIVFRRVCFLVSVLYFIRAFTMYVTVFPTASTTYYCSPKLNSTSPFVMMRQALSVLSGFGLSMNGKHIYCGDYMYSGHTITLVLTYLFVQEYSPRCSWMWTVLHWFIWALSMAGVILILIARGHYTIDIIVAYFFTTRIFWIYHTLANNDFLKIPSENNFISRVWWYPLFQFLEGNVNGILPRQYSIPYTDYYFDPEI